MISRRSLSVYSTVFILVAATLCGQVSAQHDLHRNAMRLLCRGGTDLDKAIGQLKEEQDDPESRYLLMLASCLRKDSPQAMAYAKQAVEAGLPFERILAGPRDVLAPLYASADFEAWAASHRITLLHGPMVGCVTDKSARVWMRTVRESMVGVEAVSVDDSTRSISSKPVPTTVDEDYTAIVELAGLSPGTTYRYDVLVHGKEVGRGGSFRTYPEVGSSGQFAVVFGGGAGFVPEHERMWDSIAARGPLAFLMLGDNVYIDDPTHLRTHEYCYYRRQSRLEWRRLVASTSVYAIYDDHDFGTNDCVPGPEIDNPPWKREVWRVFKQNWINPAYGGGRKQPGCWFDFHIGDVHFFLLDGRYYRDLKGGSLLGPAQKAWLLKTLEHSEATFRVLASDVPWSEGVKPGSKDTWDGFPEEREEIFAFIERQEIDGVLLISADRHRSDIRRNERQQGYDLYEFESSRLTNRHTHGIVKTPGLIFGYNQKCSFGLLRFDTKKADPQVSLEIVNIDGQSVCSMDLTVSQLSR